MAFIRTIPPSRAQGPVAEMYEQAQRRFGYVPNWAIFDIAAAAAARCFFSKLLDALAVPADSSYNDLDPALRVALTVGRPVAARTDS